MCEQIHAMKASLTPVQQEVIKLLAESPGQVDSPFGIMERSRYAQHSTYEALVALEQVGYVRQIQQEGETVHYKITSQQA